MVKKPEMCMLQPAMKAREIADRGIEALKSGKYKNVRLNFANPDMVCLFSLPSPMIADYLVNHVPFPAIRK